MPLWPMRSCVANFLRTYNDIYSIVLLMKELTSMLGCRRTTITVTCDWPMMSMIFRLLNYFEERNRKKIGIMVMKMHALKSEKNGEWLDYLS